MKVALFDFQIDALEKIRRALVKARRTVSTEDQHVVAFSAATGSGKTIMMTALFEAILVEPDEQLAWPLDWVPQPDAVILWLSDMPELNEQTKLKIERMSDKVNRVSQLVTIDSHFDAPRLEAGRVYFINTQKLAVNQPLTNHGDGRQHLIWETLTNTAQAIPDRFYVVIDEAHRGALKGAVAAQARTLMQRFVLGHPETGLVKMPLVVGVSATPTRFLDLIQQAAYTLTMHKVLIPSAEVCTSGLLKDRILIHHPEAATTAEMALLEEAARRWAQMAAAWAAYCKNEGVESVWPVLVVQIENASCSNPVTQTDLGAALNVIESAIGRRLHEGEVVHALHDMGDLDLGGRRMRKVEASRIDADKNIGVVFFKTSLSTGWDCPRAEVMMSFRRSEDATSVAQLLGRMVRTPLARRIERDAALNDVHLFLPYFNTQTVKSVVASLNDADEAPPAETGSGRELVVLKRREGTEALFAALDRTVTYRVNAVRAQSALRRFIALARNLTLDEISVDEWKTAKEQFVGWMTACVQALKAAGAFESEAKAVTQVGLRTITVQNGTGTPDPIGHEIKAADVDIDRLFEEAGRVFGNGLHQDYWRAQGDRPALDVKVEVIVLASNGAEITALEGLAAAAFDALYDLHKNTVAQLKEPRRITYEKLRLASATVDAVPWRLPESIDFNRKPEDRLWERHLYVEEDGKFRVELGAWEAEVLKEELAKPNVVGWLRNVDRKPWSLEIPYESGGATKPMFPDLVIVRQEANGFVIDVLEPHRPDLGDNFEKAVGLAKFADRQGALFGRIQLIRKQSNAGGEHFSRLEINKTATIRKLLRINSNPLLDAVFTAAAT